MEANTLLDPIDANAPCGPNLEYDSEFLALEQSSRAKPEQQFGKTVVPAEEPDWLDVQRRAKILLSSSKDLRLAVVLTRALARCEGMPGLAFGLNLIHELLSRYWDSLHPSLDPEDGHDPTMRLNALGPLTDPNSLLRDVRCIVLTNNGKTLSLRDALAALGMYPIGPGAAPGVVEVEEVLQSPQNAQTIDSARNALAAVARIHSLLVDKLGDTQAPDLQPLSAMLHAIVHAVEKNLNDIPEQPTQDASSAAMPSDQLSLSSSIRSREDVIRLLDKICLYIERTEPANPAPLLIRRAQRLMSKNFIEIINDLAPESLAQIRHIAGVASE